MCWCRCLPRRLGRIARPCLRFKAGSMPKMLRWAIRPPALVELTGKLGLLGCPENTCSDRPAKRLFLGSCMPIAIHGIYQVGPPCHNLRLINGGRFAHSRRCCSDLTCWLLFLMKAAFFRGNLVKKFTKSCGFTVVGAGQPVSFTAPSASLPK